MISPYEESAAQAIAELNEAIVRAMELDRDFRVEKVLPGQRYGIVTFRSLREIRAARGGGATLEALFDILLIAGAKGRIESESNAFRLAIALDSAIPSFKGYVSAGLIRDIRQDGEITASHSQAIAETNGVHPWRCQVVAGLIADIVVWKDIEGKHYELRQN